MNKMDRENKRELFKIIRRKLKEKTGKSLLKASPMEIKTAFRHTVANVALTKHALRERNRLMRLRK